MTKRCSLVSAAVAPLRSGRAFVVACCRVRRSSLVYRAKAPQCSRHGFASGVRRSHPVRSRLQCVFCHSGRRLPLARAASVWVWAEEQHQRSCSGRWSRRVELPARLVEHLHSSRVDAVEQQVLDGVGCAAVWARLRWSAASLEVRVLASEPKDRRRQSARLQLCVRERRCYLELESLVGCARRVLFVLLLLSDAYEVDAHSCRSRVAVAGQVGVVVAVAAAATEVPR